MQTVTRLFDFPYYQLEKYPLAKSLVTKSDGKWIATSTQEDVDKANAVSRALLRMGIKPNDKVAIISMTNRTEWNIIDIKANEMILSHQYFTEKEEGQYICKLYRLNMIYD